MVIEVKEQKYRESLSLPTVFGLKHKGILTRLFLTLEIWSNTKCDAELRSEGRGFDFLILKNSLVFFPC